MKVETKIQMGLVLLGYLTIKEMILFLFNAFQICILKLKRF